jgi:transcription antitermination factor NusG
MQQSSSSLSWYVLKAYYNNVDSILSTLKAHSEETYIPMETIMREDREGSMVKTTRPLIPGMVFFRCDGREVLVLRELLTDKAFIYHRHVGDRREPAPINDKELNNFRRFVASCQHYEHVDCQSINLSKGHRVRVIDGPYKGFEGRVCRVKGNRHLVIAVTGACAVMLIDYIPHDFLQKIE